MPYRDKAKERAYRRKVAKLRTPEQRRLEKRRQRARWRRAGLSARGKPIKDRAQQTRVLLRLGQCPHGCQCYDCLWGEA